MVGICCTPRIVVRTRNIFLIFGILGSEVSLPRPTKTTGVLTLRLRECSPVLLEFPDRGKKLPVRKATNCSLQSAVASGGSKVAGRVTDARAIEFWRRKHHVS